MAREGSMSTSIKTNQRFTSKQRCPICGGHSQIAQGKGERCYGFLSDDGDWAHCTRTEHAGSLEMHESSSTYAHKLKGDCKCGTRHDPSLASTSQPAPLRIHWYLIRDEHGEIVAKHKRVDQASGAKECIWYRPDDSIGLNGRRLETLPLYGVHLFKDRPGESVIVVEGEKAADALIAAGRLAVGTVTGAKVIPSPDVLRQLLGREITLWPDNDDDGRSHMAGIGARLMSMGAQPQTIIWADAPPKGDAYDFIQKCGSNGKLDLLIDQATPYDSGTETATPARKLLHVSELHTLPKTEDIIPGVLSKNKLNLVYGLPGVGKSLVNLDIALTVSQYAPVVYLAGEDAEEYLPRVQAWSEHHGAEAGSLYFWPEPVNLLNPDSVAAFLAEVGPLNPALIVVDTLATCMTGADENSTKEMGVAIEALHYVRRQTQAGLLICHHTGWADTHERGSSALRGAVRIAMKVAQSDDGLISVTCEKSNNAAPFEPRYFRLLPKGESVTVVPSSKLTGRDAPLKQKHYDILEALNLPIFADGASFTQLVEHTAMAKSTVNYALSKLLERSYVVTTEGRNKIYSLTGTGKAELQGFLFQSADQSSTQVQPKFNGDLELALNWTVTLPQVQETSSNVVQASSTQVQPSSTQVQDPNLDPSEFSSTPTPLEGGTLNLEQAEQEIEQPKPPSDSDRARAEKVQEAIDAGDLVTAKTQANRIDSRALWDAMLDKVDTAKQVPT